MAQRLAQEKDLSTGEFVMRTRMVRMDMAQRLNAHRVLSLVLFLLALVGWGAFAYSAGSSASAVRDLRAELAQLKPNQDQLLAERSHRQEAVGDLIPARRLWTDPS